MTERQEPYIKIPFYWFDLFETVSDEEAGKLFKDIVEYGSYSVLPDFAKYTDYQKEIWQIMKRDIDFQREHPHAGKYTDDEAKMIRNSQIYANWRKSVFERDVYTCQICGQKGGRLNAHHIKRFADYPDKRLELDNGITLCESCHRKVHRKEIFLEK